MRDVGLVEFAIALGEIDDAFRDADDAHDSPAESAGKECDRKHNQPGGIIA